MLKHPGPGGPRPHPSKDQKRYSALIKIMKGEPVKVRKVRGKDKCVRRQPEADLRKDVVKFFKKHGIYYKRIENSLPGTHAKGLPDFLIFTKVVGMNLYPPSRFYFVELKSSIGKLRPEQEHFKALCERSGTGYILARSVGDIEGAIGC